MVAKAFSFRRSFHQTGDVIELESGVDLPLGMKHIAQEAKPVVRNDYHPGIWLNCGEWVIRGFNVRVRNSVEQRGFADVWQSDYSSF